jgi:hypothetical protein
MDETIQPTVYETAQSQTACLKGMVQFALLNTGDYFPDGFRDEFHLAYGTCLMEIGDYLYNSDDNVRGNKQSICVDLCKTSQDLIQASSYPLLEKIRPELDHLKQDLRMNVQNIITTIDAMDETKRPDLGAGLEFLRKVAENLDPDAPAQVNEQIDYSCC